MFVLFAHSALNRCEILVQHFKQIYILGNEYIQVFVQEGGCQYIYIYVCVCVCVCGGGGGGGGGGGRDRPNKTSNSCCTFSSIM